MNRHQLGILDLIANKLFSFFLKSFWWTHVLFWGHCYPSGAAPTDLLKASMAAGRFPTCISRGGIWLSR